MYYINTHKYVQSTRALRILESWPTKMRSRSFQNSLVENSLEYRAWCRRGGSNVATLVERPRPLLLSVSFHRFYSPRVLYNCLPPPSPIHFTSSTSNKRNPCVGVGRGGMLCTAALYVLLKSAFAHPSNNYNTPIGLETLYLLKSVCEWVCPPIYFVTLIYNRRYVGMVCL